MRRRNHMPFHPLRDAGYSLIEMMISLTLGLIIMAALGGMLVEQLNLRSELDRSSRMIGNGTYAISLLSSELKLAGFYDAMDPTALALPAAMPDPCSETAADIAAALRLHVQGYDAATATSAAAAPPACVTGAATALRTGSDILVIRRADTAVAIDPAAATNGTHYLQASLCPLDTATFLLDAYPVNLTLRQKGCTASSTTPYAQVRPFHVEIYFVDGNHEAGDGVPTLKKIALRDGVFGDPVSLVEGVEFLQVEYGLDNDADGVADSYSSCAACTVANWASVVSAKLHLVARAHEPTRGYVEDKVFTLGTAGTVGPYNDTIKRASYQQLVRLVNPSARRELP